jgi:hypothetical protein
MTMKRIMAKGDEKKMLSYWNGDMTGKYAKEDLDKMKTKKE